MIPVVPEGSYEFTVSLTRHQDDREDNLILPVGKSACLLSLGSREWIGLQIVAGDWIEKSRVRPSVEDYLAGKKHEVHVKVLLKDPVTADITAFLNGKELLHWVGPVDALIPREDWRLHPSALGFGTHDGHLVYHSAQFRILSGKAFSARMVARARHRPPLPC